MEPAAYLLPLIEAEYAAEHTDLTSAARELLRSEIRSSPEKYTRSERSQALVTYANARAHLVRGYDAISDLPDEEFEPEREKLFSETRRALAAAVRLDPLCVDARLLDALLGARTYDDCIRDMLTLEQEARTYLERAHDGFDAENPVLLPQQPAPVGGAANSEGAGGKPTGGGGADMPQDTPAGAPADAPTSAQPATGSGAAHGTEQTPNVPDPVMVGWLHTVDALSQSCIATARYRVAERYARLLLRAQGYPSGAEGTLFLALARLEDEGAFFDAAEMCRKEHGLAVDDSPWFLLSRALLFYKVGKRKQARRAVKDFALRAEGGAYFLGSPVFPAPYFPVRPEPLEPWDLAQQAVYEADGILIDTPDFVPWATAIEEVDRAAEQFAKRNDFL